MRPVLRSSGRRGGRDSLWGRSDRGPFSANRPRGRRFRERPYKPCPSRRTRAGVSESRVRVAVSESLYPSPVSDSPYRVSCLNSRARLGQDKHPGRTRIRRPGPPRPAEFSAGAARACLWLPLCRSTSCCLPACIHAFSLSVCTSAWVQACLTFFSVRRSVPCCVCTQFACMSDCVPTGSACLPACMCACLFVCLHVSVCLHVFLNVCHVLPGFLSFCL